MIKSLKKLVWKSLNLLKIGGAIQLHLKSGLKEEGWFNSYHKKQSVDLRNKPLPWFTYPFIKFIEPRLNKNFTAYEYGSGNSTLWFAERINKVVSMEHDEKWFEKVKQELPLNVKLYYESIDDGTKYEDEILLEEGEFDVIIIDGRKRVKCVANALKKIKPTGIVIFDNSERVEYKDSLTLLKDKGYKNIDFWGIGPIIHFNTCTSIYYRANNCMNI